MNAWARERIPFRLFAGVLLLVAAGLGTARGDERLDPLRVGLVQMSPSIGLDGRYEDNVERANEDDPFVGRISSFIRELRPELRIEIPLSASFVQLGYRGILKEYSAPELAGADGWTHYFNFQGRFQVAPALRLDLTDRAVDGVSEVTDYIPGGELRFTTQPLRSNAAALTLALDGGGLHSAEMGGTLDSSHIEIGETAQSVFDFKSQGLFGRYLYRAGAATQIYLSLNYEAVEQGRGTPEIEPDDYRIRAAGVGFRRQSSREMGSELRMAFADTRFVGDSGTPFRGLVFDGTFNGPLGPASQWSLRMRRGPQVSFFNVNAYYLNNRIEALYRQALGLFVELELGFSYQHNAYPEPVNVYATDPGDAEFDLDGDGIIDAYANLLPSQGVRRRDDLASAMLGVRWSLGRAVDLSVGYRMENADSNIEALDDIDAVSPMEYSIYDYDSRSVHLLVAFGWQ